MFMVLFALFAGISAAFTVWLFSVAFIDCVLHASWGEPSQMASIESPHERSARA